MCVRCEDIDYPVADVWRPCYDYEIRPKLLEADYYDRLRSSSSVPDTTELMSLMDDLRDAIESLKDGKPVALPQRPNPERKQTQGGTL